MQLPSYLKLLPVVCLMVVVTGCSKEATQTRSLDRARSFYESGDYEKAKIEYLSILRKDRNNAEAIAQVGMIWANQGAVLQSLPYLRKARDLGSLPEDARMRLAFALMSVGMVEEARAEAEAALQADPSHGEALLFLADSVRSEEEVAAMQKRMQELPFKESAAFHLAQAALVRKTGRLAEAEAAVDRALEADSGSVHALLAKGALLQHRKEFDTAADFLQRGSQLAAPRSSERLKYIDYLAQRGKVEEASRLAADAARETPDYIPALIIAARMQSGLRQYDDGLKTLEKVFAQDSPNIDARLLQAEILTSKKEPEEAAKVLERLDQMYTGVPSIRLKLARAHMQAGDFTAASDLLKQLLLQPQKNWEVEASMLLAEVNFRQGNPAAVVPAMQALLEKYPKARGASLMLAQAYEAQRRYDEALRVIRDLLDQSPEDSTLLARLGNLLLHAGEMDEARLTFEKIHAMSPQEVMAWRNLIELDIQEGKTDAALDRVRAQHEKTPGAAVVSFIESRVRIGREEWDEAEAALLKTLELDPNFPNAHEVLSRIYISQQKLPEAVAKVEERLAIDPKDASALNLYATLLTAQKEYAKAAEVYERLRASQPNPAPFVLNNLAALYADHLDKLDEALDLARQARALRPSVAAAVSDSLKLEAAAIADTLGWILYRKKEFAESYNLLEEATSVLTQHPEALAHFGLAAAAMGQSEKAQAALTQAVADPADFVAKEEARKRLALLTRSPTEAASREELAAMVAESPEDPLLQLQFAESCEKESLWAEAAQAYQAALARNPSLTSAVVRLAHLYSGPLAEPTLALEWARKAREAKPNDPEIAALLGGQLLEQGDHAWAYTLLREAEQAGQTDPATLAALAAAAYSNGHITEARGHMQKALATATDPPLREKAESFLVLTTMPPPEISKAEEQLKSDPDNVPALMIRAAHQSLADDSTAAVDSYAQILKIYPSFAPAMARLATLLAEKPATRARANEFALKARSILPDDPYVLEALGRLAYHRQEHQYALDLINEAAKHRPPSASALYDTGRTQLALGDTPAARKALTAATASGLPASEAAEAAKLLEKHPEL